VWGSRMNCGQGQRMCVRHAITMWWYFMLIIEFTTGFNEVWITRKSSRALITAQMHTLLIQSNHSVSSHRFSMITLAIKEGFHQSVYRIQCQRSLDEMLASEVRPEVHDLPATKSHQRRHNRQRKELDTLVGALVGISQLLFAPPQVIHLVDDLGGDGFDASQLDFDRLQLFRRLDRGPVTRVRTDVHV